MNRFCVDNVVLTSRHDFTEYDLGPEIQCEFLDMLNMLI